MTYTLSEMKQKNISVGQHFFDRGNPRVEVKYGNYLVTKGMGDGYVIYKFDTSSGRINLVENPSGEYSWQPYNSKAEAVNYAKKLASGNN